MGETKGLGVGGPWGINGERSFRLVHLSCPGKSFTFSLSVSPQLCCSTKVSGVTSWL